LARAFAPHVGCVAAKSFQSGLDGSGASTQMTLGGGGSSLFSFIILKGQGQRDNGRANQGEGVGDECDDVKHLFFVSCEF